ncbi:hypothetical protein [Bremerella sp. P1]|uniref:hypothetical protein n=1 Tax=Bremerella sp. P1 TaxID=3026424 RepID=UPI002368DB83|nr:hypothetical protein [Bremerella sp. P1]WDI42565.1 hypothetical protein PSR63_01225 [Bremerella sp. P1]
MKKARSRSASKNSIRRHWNHVSRLEQLEGREMLNATTELVSLRLAATDLHGNPITQIEQGEKFLIKAYIDDRRDEPEVDVTPVPGSISSDAVGFFSAYFNVTFDSAGFDFDPTYGQGGVMYGPSINPVYLTPPTPNVEFDGYIERLGVENLNIGVPGEIEILSFRMIAQTPNVYDMAEAFIPHFHFDVADIFEDPNELEEDWEPIYVDGVPQLERLTGSEFTAATEDDHFALYQYATKPLTDDSEVYFEGIDLEVISSTDADYELRFVTTQTTTIGGEVNSLPSSVVTIDEWNHFYVEIYAQAPAGNAIQAGFVELNYNPDDFKFIRAIGRSQDPTSLRYSITSTDVDEQNGTIRVGFSTLSTNLGDDRYALIGRIQMRSDMELPVDYTSGELTFTPSSQITLTDTNATIINTTTSVSAIIDGSATASHSFEVWPVIYDVGANGEDRKVGIPDFSGFIGQFGKFVNNDPLIRKFDFNNSGRVDLDDFSLFIQNFGESDASPTTRTYLPGYPGDLGGAPLMASRFVLEGEAVDVRTVPQTTTSTTTPTTDIPEDDTASISSQSIGTTLPLTQTLPTDNSSDDESQDNAIASPVAENTDVVISTLDDQTDLIVMSSEESESPLTSDEDDPEFAEHADEVLAIWEDENAL